MLNTAGLSLEQAPPIEVPFGFFLLAPLFVFLAGAALVWQGDLVLLSRWSAPALAVTHLLTLGFLTQVMCGALFQMLPVLAGSAVPAAVWIGRFAQAGLALGCLALSWGLYAGGRSWLMLGGTALGVGIGIFVIGAGIAMVRARGVPDTLRGMRLALFGLVMTLLLGLMLLGGLLGARIPRFTDWVDLHLSWGLLGWMGMLIMAVGYQVVPMFHVTPAYPARLRRAAAPVAAAALVVATVLVGAGRADLSTWVLSVTILTLVVFAATTLWLQSRRERPRLDTTLLYWRISMGLAMVSAMIWLLRGPSEVLGVLVLIGIGVGLPTGMLLKIMPFLSWFHLQHRQLAMRRFDVRLPHMQVFVPDGLARVQLGVFSTMLVLLTLAAGLAGQGWADGLARAGGVALMLTAGLLSWLQWSGYRVYRRIRRQLD